MASLKNTYATSHILYTTLQDAQAHYDKGRVFGDVIRKDRTFSECTVIVDEVDNMFLDRAGHACELTEPTPGFDFLIPLMLYIWRLVTPDVVRSVATAAQDAAAAAAADDDDDDDDGGASESKAGDDDGIDVDDGGTSDSKAGDIDWEGEDDEGEELVQAVIEYAVNEVTNEVMAHMEAADALVKPTGDDPTESTEKVDKGTECTLYTVVPQADVPTTA